jgi:hypothetical protein
LYFEALHWCSTKAIKVNLKVLIYLKESIWEANSIYLIIPM